MTGVRGRAPAAAEASSFAKASTAAEALADESADRLARQGQLFWQRDREPEDTQRKCLGAVA